MLNLSNPFNLRDYMSNFHDMGLPVSIIRSLEKMNCTVPTPIQAQAIPFALKDRDILGSAQTGTGKTLAFAIPLVNKLLKSNHGTALVLAPTRELALQVMNSIKQVLNNEHSHLRATLLIGGESMYKQLGALKAKPRILVGTPGRVIDHMSRGTLRGEDVVFLVLDEMDRMFDMGFGIQIEKIVSRLPKERQTLMFSATLPSNIANLAQKYMSHPERVSIGSTTAPATRIKQEVIRVAEAEKYQNLLSQIESRDGSIIVFVNTKRGAEKLADRLRDKNHNASAIHGDLRQQKRSKIISAFRAGRSRIMVATDVAARGLDIPLIQTVINYELPQCPEDYIHRIGRTARAGAEGSAVCLLAPQEGRRWSIIDKLMNPNREAHPDDNNGPASLQNKRKGGGRNFRGKGYKEDRRSGGKSFRAPREGGFKSNSERRSFKEPREGSFKGDGESNSFRAPREGGFKGDGERRRFKDSREGGFKGNSERRSFKDSREGGFKGDGERRRFKDSREGGFNGNSERRSFKDSREGGFKGDGERRSFKDSREGGFKGDGERRRFKDSREGGYKSDSDRNRDRAAGAEGTYRKSRNADTGFRKRSDGSAGKFKTSGNSFRSNRDNRSSFAA
jgi:ATP-dependent RNA helicase DeaD